MTQVIGPQLYFSWEAPFYYTGLYCDIGAWTGLFLTCLVMGLYLKYLNKKKRERRIELGLPAELQDMSIMSIPEAARYRAELTTALRASGFDETKLFEGAFDDMTDIEWVASGAEEWAFADGFRNPIFMYVV